MKKALLRFVSKIRRRQVDPSWSGRAIREYTSLTPVKEARAGLALSKAGRLVMQGERGGVPIKLFEAANAEHARLIQAVSVHADVGEHFPSIHAVHGAFVVAAWIPRFSNETPSLDALVAVQLRIHQIAPAEVPSPGFDYWSELIQPRFSRAATLLDEEDLAESVVADVVVAWKQPRQYLMHPDLTPANVVRGGPGKWQIIDNELLTIGGLPLLDVCNTAHSLGTKAGRSYADLYLEKAGVTITPKDLDVLQSAWLARRVGSAFVAGDLQYADALIRQYELGQNILPFSPTIR